jgi:hypothetical protein
VDFATDYDRENPVTKNDGLVRLMEKKLGSANISEEEKQRLMAQMNNVKHASVADAFRSYTLQKDAQSYYMQSMAQQRMMYQMPMMMTRGGYAMAGYNPYGY